MNEETNTNTDTARLEALGAATQEIDSANPTPEQAQQQEQEAQQVSQTEQGAKEWGLLLFSLGGLLSMIAAELKPVYSEDRCMLWGQHMQVVCDKHGWGSPKHSPEVSLLMVSIGFVVPTVLILPDRIRAAKKLNNSFVGRVAGWWARRRGAQPAKAEEQPDGGQQ